MMEIHSLTKKSYHYNIKPYNRIHMKLIMIARDNDKCFLDGEKYGRDWCKRLVYGHKEK